LVLNDGCAALTSPESGCPALAYHLRPITLIAAAAKSAGVPPKARPALRDLIVSIEAEP